MSIKDLLFCPCGEVSCDKHGPPMPMPEEMQILLEENPFDYMGMQKSVSEDNFTEWTCMCGSNKFAKVAVGILRCQCGNEINY
jgi:hypothetical protein